MNESQPTYMYLYIIKLHFLVYFGVTFYFALTLKILIVFIFYACAYNKY